MININNIMMFVYILILLFNHNIQSLKLLPHPLEKRICYVEGIEDVRELSPYTIELLKSEFRFKSSMLIFKNQPRLTPHEFLDFVKIFDDNLDEDAFISDKSMTYVNSNKMLQPFDQFPDCNHVAPRGNHYIKEYYGIKDLQVYPTDYFKENYLWHSDTWGHPTKIMNKITGFYVIHQPLLGGETDFISGETIYENLSELEKLAYKNIELEVSRESLLEAIKDNVALMDYSGSYFKFNDIYKKASKESLSIVKLINFPDNKNYLNPCLLISPAFVEKVKGWDLQESREWLTLLMNLNILPHRVTIQWKKGDVAVFNNKLFIHSSTPANRYLENELSNKRFLLQTFLPTKD